VKTVLIIADLQIPYHDQKYVDVMEKFIAEFKPDEVGQIGDLMDQPQPSRWTKGRAGEYADTLQADVDLTKEIVERLRLNWIKMGNHDERIEAYVERYAPALASLTSLRYEELLGLDGNGVALHRNPVEVAPGWIAAHGHEGGLSPVAGRTAFSLAKRYDQSVLCGHTHRAGIVAEQLGLGGRVRQLMGMEVGHGMDLSQATYVKGPNWQQAFGMLYVDGDHVQPELTYVKDGRFIHQGKVWSA
jgi:hypothetical protein